MQATRLLALTLAIVLSPRLAMTDVVGRVGDTTIGAVASAAGTVESHGATEGAGTAAVSCESAEDQSGTAVASSSTPKMKGRWGSLRRVPLLRRPASKAWGTTSAQDGSCLLTLPLTSSFSNSSGASGLANRNP